MLKNLNLSSPLKKKTLCCITGGVNWKEKIEKAVRRYRDLEPNSSSKEHGYKVHWFTVTSLILHVLINYTICQPSLVSHEAWSQLNPKFKTSLQGQTWWWWTFRLVLQFSILTRGGSADRTGALRWAPSLHVVGTHSHIVIHSLHWKSSRVPNNHCALTSWITHCGTKEWESALIINSSYRAPWGCGKHSPVERGSISNKYILSAVCVGTCACCLTHRCQSVDDIGGVPRFCNMGRTKDAFETGRRAPLHCSEEEDKTNSLTDKILSGFAQCSNKQEQRIWVFTVQRTRLNLLLAEGYKAAAKVTPILDAQTKGCFCFSKPAWQCVVFWFYWTETKRNQTPFCFYSAKFQIIYYPFQKKRHNIPDLVFSRF